MAKHKSTGKLTKKQVAAEIERLDSKADRLYETLRELDKDLEKLDVKRRAIINQEIDIERKIMSIAKQIKTLKGIE